MLAVDGMSAPGVQSDVIFGISLWGEFVQQNQFQRKFR